MVVALAYWVLGRVMVGGESVGVELISLAGIVLTALFGLAGSWVSSRGAKEKSFSEQYKALVDDIQEWTETRLAERDERIEELRKETEMLRASLAKVEEDMRLWRERYRAAVDYIVRLRDMIPAARRPQVPEVLHGDLSEKE